MSFEEPDYERQPAAEFLFERRPLRRRHRLDAERGGAFLVVGDQPPHLLTRHEERVIRRDDAPTLTVTSDPRNSVAVVAGSGSDWNVYFWAEGGGQTEVEANQRLQESLFSVSGSTVSLSRPILYDERNARCELLVEAPRDAGVVIHTTRSVVEVYDLTGPVRIAAAHARATILDTIGQVDATAFCVDFAGSGGRVTLSAEAEINLKITAREFQGRLVAWAQRSVRMLVPEGFSTPFEAIVGSPDDFVCRADFRSQVKQDRREPLYAFTYAIGDDDASRARLHLRSEASIVVIDQF